MYELKTAVAKHPAIALPLARRRGHGEVVSRDTDIVIEAFPRCASSFAVAAFRLAQEPRAVRVAHHTHAPAQVIAAVRMGIPALVLIREPEDAVLSLLIRTPDRTVGAATRGYLRFYEPLLPHRAGFVVGTFAEVVGSFGAVVRRVNRRFGTRFGEFEHTEANVARVNREIEEDYRSRASDDDELERIIPRPSDVRERMKEELRAAYRAEATRSLRERAGAVYELLARDPDA